jgi:hypothetical protein
MFFSISGKFAPDARKAFFSELSTRLEMMAEVLSPATPESEFDEIIEIVTALKTQAISFQADRIVAEYAAKRAAQEKKDEVKF